MFREVAAEAEEIIVGIAAAADPCTAQNPFTAGERNRMVRLALDDAGIAPYRVVDLPDIGNPPVWPHYVADLCPPFDVVVAHSDETLGLFEAAGYETRKATAYERETYSGTRIRELMAEGGDWSALVPGPVAEFLDGLGASSRLGRLAEF